MGAAIVAYIDRIFSFIKERSPLIELRAAGRHTIKIFARSNWRQTNRCYDSTLINAGHLDAHTHKSLYFWPETRLLTQRWHTVFIVQKFMT